MRLKDKVIIVTGSTTGVGEGIARRCVAEGARVLIHGRDEQRAATIAGELGAATACHVDDIADPEAPKRIVDAAVNAFGKLDAICNNAAWVVRSDIDTTDVEMFDRVIAINTRAPFLMIKAALPHLTATQGCVLNIGSINGYCGEGNQFAYSVSKGALITLSRNLSDALGTKKVRVNHFNLGWVLTPNEYKLKISEGLPEDWPTTLPGVYAPSGRILSPADVAAAAVYWLGDESRPVSGTVLELEQYPMIGRNPVKEGD
ncbi:MAG: SDR family oxidoreductase [Phycisphaeraceae bacterium]|jgi:NAD(P)-dependent dehydrogenase (short-subunit alcohol dehydrogenase family)|nr:SDR family oxidoreductase [Phycisphaeraceae bacterium]